MRPLEEIDRLVSYDLVSIDPGRRTGVACWLRGELVRVEVVTMALGDTGPVRELPEAAAAVVELPQAWGRVPAQDLITLAWIAGACSAQYERVVPVAPVKWRRGNMPKAILAGRIMDRLTPAERAIVDAAAQGGGHAVDAVGIGLWALGRYP